MSQPRSGLDGLRIERDDAPRTSNRLLVAGAAIVAIAVIGIGAWLHVRSRAVEVRTAVAQQAAGGADGIVLNASGYVTARREATVSSKVTGKVVEVLVEEGMQVTAGQVLARLDDANTSASLRLAHAQAAAAKAAIEETRVRLREAELDFSRQSDLRRSNVSAQADLDHAEAAVLALRARLGQQEAEAAVAEHTVGIWEQQLDDTVIRAPFAGTATSKNAQPGEMISPMSTGGFTRTGICTIVDMQSLEIEIDVNESYINRVRPAQSVEATLDAYPNWKIPCHVIAIIPTADRNKSTVRVRVGFDQLDPRILPEMSVKVGFRETGGASASAAGSRAVVVPNAAIDRHGERAIVLVVRGDRAERRAVSAGPAQGESTVVTAGLAAGERVVLEPSPALADGARIKAVNR